MKAYVVFEGKTDLNAFITMAKAALVNIDTELQIRKNKRKEIDALVLEHRALPFFKRCMKDAPHYPEYLLFGHENLKRYRNEVVNLIESATSASAIHINNDDMDRLSGWAK